MKMTSVPQEWYHEWKNFYMTILGLICLHSQNRHLSQEENRASVAYCSCIEVHLCNTMEREGLGHTIFELIPYFGPYRNTPYKKYYNGPSGS